MLDNSSDEAYISSVMPDDDSQIRKNLGSDVAKAMVSAVLAASPRVDTFSTWLMGVTTGFLVLLFTNIERTVTVIKIGPVKALIVVLAVSTVMGLLQKWLALQLHVQVDIQEAATRKVVEAVRVHSGESMADPHRYIREHADVVHMLVLFISTFPKWMQKIIHKMILSKTMPDLSHLQKDTKNFAWQCAALGLQLFFALVTVVIVLFSL